MQTNQLSAIIVDKHPMMRTALSAALSSTETLSVLAEYAEIKDALNATFHSAPHLILLGIGNPGTDELTMIRRLRHSFPRTKILVMVSGELPGQEEDALRYGAHDVLEKTVSRHELIDRLMNRFQKTAFTTSCGEENVKI